ncbi:tyrosine-type recombinase/integrase [Polaribacter sp. R77954]|uniref:tyrosine-type recombinase/integrase n=1 Tax=Polaribacter sp. R77954 TaxID=3093870 RepID=UPI0037CBFB80
MNFTFNLRKPKSKIETLIVFSTYIKEERKKFVYSTGESILPSLWNFENRQPRNLTGRSKESEDSRAIKRQLDRYEHFYIELANRHKITNESLDSETLKIEFDKHFKKVKPISNVFFDIYEIFIQNKSLDFSDQRNADSTINRYKYNKKLLEEFQRDTKTTIHFSKIDQAFYQKLLNYCIQTKEHSANTLRRNIGLFKTFLNWALENKHTYNDKFKAFKSPQAFATNEVALSIEQVKEIADLDLSDKPKLERVRDLFIIGCTTGLRISNYGSIKKQDVIDNEIWVSDVKDKNKQLKIPLNPISKKIFEKYDYNLPKISNQKFNDYIKDVFEEAKFNHLIKKTYRIGNEVKEEFKPFYKRISSHTARRSFITIMKNEKVPDKVIMSITGHKSLEVFNKYYKPSKKDKIEFMNSVFK